MNFMFDKKQLPIHDDKSLEVLKSLPKLIANPIF